jgi:RNA polymerase sigma-70 factor, ECF subfamily
MSGSNGAARRGAVEQLFVSLLPFLQRWARGRLPPYARRRMDSSDLVQDAMVQALRRAGELDQLSAKSLRLYLQTCILNRIRDEIRRASRGEVRNGPLPATTDGRPDPLDDAIESEERRRYREALLRLANEDRVLLVGRIELGLSYDDLALVTRRPTAEATRAAARRAALRLARTMGGEERERAAGG